MMTTDLGACEWFVWDLRRSNLIDRGQLDQIVGEFLAKNPGAEPPQLAEFLIAQNVLTDFQAERLLQGKTQGFVLGPFTLMDALGTGSMGTVYKAQNKNDNQWYAVKVLPRRSMWNVRIARRKVRLFEQCQSTSVVPFVDVGTSGGMHYLAWPLVEGRTLDKIVADQGKLTPEQSAQYALQTAEGLEAAHQVGLFHGLLKPSNLMVGEGPIKILDFGIGCLLAETEGESLVDTMSTANSVNSGLDCASPESIMDPTNLNAVGDQYSLGCVLYYCLTGCYPFPDGTAVEKMMCHQHKQPKPIKEFSPEVPDELVAVVEKLMSKNPCDRYASCAQVIEVLRPLTSVGGAPVVQRRATMQMPRVRLPRPGAGESAVPTGLGGEPAAPARPQAPARAPVQPLPPRAPSAMQSAPQAPAVPPRGAAPRPVAPTAPSFDEPEYEDTTSALEAAEAAQPAAATTSPKAARSGGQIGTIAIVLIAAIAGVAAFFASKMLF